MQTLNKILLILNLFFLQSYLLRFQISVFPTNLQAILILLQLFTFVYVTPFNKILKGISKHWIIATFIILTILSILLAPIVDRQDFARHFQFLIFAAILSFIFLESLPKESEKKAAIRIMGIGAIFFGIFSIFHNLLGYNQAEDLRLLGPLDSAVYLAYYLTPFFIFFAIEFLENTRKKSNLIYAILLALLIAATRSMGGVVAGIIVLIIYIFKRSQLKVLKHRLTKILVITIFFLALGATFYSKILPTLQTNYSSLSERGEIWQTSIELLKNPNHITFGLGFGQFQNKYALNVKKVLNRPPLDFYVLQPHNEFLLFLFQYGLLGLFFIISCIYKILKNIAKCSTRPNLAIIASFITLYFFIHGLIDTPWFKNDLLFLLILFLEISLVRTVRRK